MCCRQWAGDGKAIYRECRRREIAMNAVAGNAPACRTFQISETCYRYSPVLSDENEDIADWLQRLTANKRT
jgi:putative transposase